MKTISVSHEKVRLLKTILGKEFSALKCIANQREICFKFPGANSEGWHTQLQSCGIQKNKMLRLAVNGTAWRSAALSGVGRLWKAFKDLGKVI